MADETDVPNDSEQNTEDAILNGGNPPEKPIDIHGGQVDDLLIEDDLKRSYLTYAMSVIVARALPDARDGLKPSQRRILVAMNDLNLGPRAKFRKCALIVGDCMGKYHPHGDQAIYPTLARMAQPWNTRYTLVQGQGNFGSENPDPPAAMRYTEARMTGPTTEMLSDLDKDTVDYQPNYDENLTEPTVLPGKFPNLLVNGSQGIAVGMATNIPPHNLTEVCNGLIHLLDHPDCTIQELMRFISGPDFPSGGLICGRAGIREAYLSGRGHLTLRAKVSFEEEKDRERIVVDEIPYQVSISRVVEKIVEAVKNDRIDGISDVSDQSGKEGIRIVIELKRGENREVVLNQLMKYTPLETTFAIQTLALVRGRPRLLNLKQMLEQYIEHRKDVITRRTRYLLAKAEEAAHLLEGLLKSLDHIDEIITIIRNSADTDLARDSLIARFGFSARQTAAILNMPLRRLTGLEREKLKSDYEKLQTEIADYKDILATPQRVLNIIKEDVEGLKKDYGDVRKSVITEAAGELELMDLVADEVMAVTVTHKGYIKREPLASYRVQSRGGKGIIGSRSKDESDFPEHLFIASTHNYLLCFVNDGRVYWLRVYDIPQLGRTAQGRAIVNLLELSGDQRVVDIVPVQDFEADASIFMVSEKGYLKKCHLSEYGNVRRGGINTMGVEEGDNLLAARYVKRGEEIVLASRMGMAVRIEESVVRDMGRAARGVNGPKLDENDAIVSVVVGSEKDFVLTVCELGYGKQTEMSEYRKVSSQRSKGVINVKVTEKNGPVVAVRPVSAGDELMIITQNGLVIRTPVSQVRETGRAAVGVKLVDLAEGDKVAAVARIAKEDAAAANEQREAIQADAREQAEREAAIQARSEEVAEPQQNRPQEGENVSHSPEIQELLRRAEDDTEKDENPDTNGEPTAP